MLDAIQNLRGWQGIRAASRAWGAPGVARGWYGIRNAWSRLRDECRRIRATCIAIRAECRRIRAECIAIRAECRRIRAGCSRLRTECAGIRAECRAIRAACRIIRAERRAIRTACRIIRAERRAFDACAAVFAGGSAGLLSGDLRVGRPVTPFLYSRGVLAGGAGWVGGLSAWPHSMVSFGEQARAALGLTARTRAIACVQAIPGSSRFRGPIPASVSGLHSIAQPLRSNGEWGGGWWGARGQRGYRAGARRVAGSCREGYRSR